MLFGHGLAACIRAVFIFEKVRCVGSEDLTITGVLIPAPIRSGRHADFGLFFRVEGSRLFLIPLALRFCTALFDHAIYRFGRRFAICGVSGNSDRCIVRPLKAESKR